MNRAQLRLPDVFGEQDLRKRKVMRLERKSDGGNG